MDNDLLEAFFEDVRDVLEEWVRLALKLTPQDGASGYTAILRCAHNLKGSAGLIGLGTLHVAMHSIEDALVHLRDQSRAPDQAVVAALLETEKLLQRWVQTLKADPNHTEDTGPLLKRWAAITAGKQNVDASDAAAAAARPVIAPKVNKQKVKSDDSLRVAVSKLDRVIQLAGEISLHHSILERAARENTLNSPTSRGAIDITGKLMQDLQDASLSLRMIPIESLVQKVERVVREAASHLQRKVKFQQQGGQVTLDKLVVEGMYDPLIHIARNAVDHGIEPPEDRILAGKSPEGSISIEAENNASGVSLIFTDDGRGIDGERVFNKAVKMGLIPADAQLSPAAKLQLIFTPGLSTAEKLTEYSGRGVGMDVVAEAVKRMGGRVEIESQIGKGTKILITLPTNLSIVDALVVKINGAQYAVPNADLSEVIDLREFNLQNVNGGLSQVIDLRGKVVPVENINAFLEGAAALKGDSGKPMPGIVVQHRDDWLALAVESVIGQQQIFVRPVMEHLSGITYYGGSTILSDGEPTLILNLPAMAERYFTTH